MSGRGEVMAMAASLREIAAEPPNACEAEDFYGQTVTSPGSGWIDGSESGGGGKFNMLELPLTSMLSKSTT